MICFCTSGTTIYANEKQSKNDVVFSKSLNQRSNNLALHTLYLLEFEAGYGYLLNYTADKSGFYAVETYGETDTYLVVEGTNIYLEDDNSGYNLDASIGLYLQEGANIQIYVFGATATTSGSTIFQVRRQRATIYTFNYGEDDIDTTPDLATPYTWLNTQFMTTSITNADASSVAEGDAAHLTRLSSEVFFFSGHGPKWKDNDGNIVGYGGAANFMNDTKLYASNLTAGAMGTTKVAMWSACYSARSDNQWGKSLIQESVAAGAKSAVGFQDSVPVSSAKVFTDQFFIELGNTMSVSAAAQSAADAVLWPWDKAKDYQIAGDGSYVVFTNNIVPRNVATLDSQLLEQFNLDTKNDKYASYDIGTNGKRFFKVISNCLTNDYYDVYYNENNEIVKIEKSACSIEGDSFATSLVYQTRSVSTPIEVSVNSNKYNLNDSDEYNVIINYKGETIPVRMIYATYTCEIAEGMLNEISEVFCYNLKTGERIDYSEINQAK